jgi:N-methylhydantoinase A
MNIVGVDIGGTFTDLVGCVDGGLITAKTSTVPADPTRGVANSLAIAGCDMAALDEVLHGSTIAINTVLERKGARTALITTKGFRDVYAIGRGNRSEAFNLFFHRPQPLIPRNMTFEVDERLNFKGEVLTKLDPAEVHALADTLAREAVESVAVCFLHSYANPAHEILVGDILRRANPGLFVTLSHESLREYREYERTSTTALNAFVGPRVRTYLRRLESHLRGEKFAGKVHIMRSNGGVMSISAAQEQPVSMMESGPVAGMIGAGKLALSMGIKRCIGFDMGGTTAKTSLIIDGKPGIEDGYVIGDDQASGQPMQLPVVDIVEVGAGGGSIAWCDGAGGIHVGPQSAGADPGPACYGNGSGKPVVTDANLVLGRINPQRFLNGGMRLDIAAAEGAIAATLGGPLGLSVKEGALGIVRIADAAMSLAVRAVSVNKGVDPRDTAMVAFGGAGPLHAVSIAREIFIPTVIIPKMPGTFSALGMLMASWRQDYAQTMIGLLGTINAAEVARIFADLAAAARDQLGRDGIPEAAARFEYLADLRYVGQEHAIAIAVQEPSQLASNCEPLKAAFNIEHAQRYGQSAVDEVLEVVKIRLVVTAPRAESLAENWLTEPWVSEAMVPDQMRDVVFDDADGPLATRIVWRPSLPAGAEVAGPAVIEEPNSTILLHPGDRAVVSDAGHLVISVALVN